MKTIVIPALVGTIVSFVLGGIIYQFFITPLFADVFKSVASVMNQNPNMVLIIVIQALLSIGIAFVLDQPKLESLGSVLKVSVLLGAGLMLWFDLWMVVSFTFMTTSMVIADVVSNTFTFIVTTSAMFFTRKRLLASVKA